MRLVTTPYSSPDIIRLWLERSGSTVPLDIEIYLRVSTAASTFGAKQRGAMTAYPLPPLPPPVPWSPPQAATALLFPPPSPPPFHPAPVGHPATATTETPETLDGDGQASNSIFGNASPDAIPTLPLPEYGNATTAAAYAGEPVPTICFNTPPTNTSRRLARKRALVRDYLTQGPRDQRTTPASWGHIALFYLSEHMHRWKRFVFRFEKGFESMSALKHICRTFQVYHSIL